MKKWRAGLWIEIALVKDGYNGGFEFGDWGEREEQGPILSFFTFFTFLGNPPLKIFESQIVAVTRTLPPWTSHHCDPHTTPYTEMVVSSWLDEFDWND